MQHFRKRGGIYQWDIAFSQVIENHILYVYVTSQWPVVVIKMKEIEKFTLCQFTRDSWNHSFLSYFVIEESVLWKMY